MPPKAPAITAPPKKNAHLLLISSRLYQPVLVESVSVCLVPHEITIEEKDLQVEVETWEQTGFEKTKTES